MAKKVSAKNGGYLLLRQPGDPAVPGAGRKKNLFRAAIQELAEAEGLVALDAELLDAEGKPTGQMVRVAVRLPGVVAVVRKMYVRAKKGDVAAARWLSETGWGKTVLLGEDEENPLPSGFRFIVEQPAGDHGKSD